MSPADAATLHALLWWAATIPPALIAGTAAARACRKQPAAAHPDACQCGPCREWAAVISAVEGSEP